ncbi:YqaA family protein [Niveispirillum sp.]|uniref:YqaA family protein n=1 Tax=Niveispirillum sp. TaxID=1917217 RepID=UPI0025D47DBE|nr:YqaA family protein [Niveispirillum sp.]
MIPLLSDPACWALFALSLAAATLLPGGSEAALIALLVAGDHPAWALVLVATAGNVLGAVINWLLGRAVRHLVGRRWFPVTAAQLARAEAVFTRYGAWTLLFSWLPVIGDPLTVAAGTLGLRLPPFLLLVTIGKAARYAVLAWVTLGLLG